MEIYHLESASGQHVYQCFTERRTEKVDIRETLKNAKREPFRAVSSYLQHSPPFVESKQGVIWGSWEPKRVPKYVHYLTSRTSRR
jgi:hypothetical protein